MTAVFRGLFFPPKCCSCGELLQEHILDTEPRALCENCRYLWEYAKLSSCERCGNELAKCRCMPRIMRRSGASVMLKMVSYDKKRDSVPRRCILYMKKKNSRAVFDYFAGQLEMLLRDYLEETYTAVDHILISYVPRGRKNVRKRGMDQSEILAKGLAERLSCDFMRLLRRSYSSSKEQKKLGKQERLDNVENAFLTENVDMRALNGKYRCIVLVDDVVTTGASLSACVKTLREGFHGRIVCICLAQTVKN
ncbi:MAG: ComF family protein [Clostridia bacterium]|nr:ComF family protein [Clostridia bacterium]